MNVKIYKIQKQIKKKKIFSKIKMKFNKIYKKNCKIKYSHRYAENSSLKKF